MLDNLTEVEGKWWDSAARVISSVLADGYETWQEFANCQVESVTDKSFIVKPHPAAAVELEQICRKCPVAMQCIEWADKNEITGAWAGGEWRE